MKNTSSLYLTRLLDFHLGPSSHPSGSSQDVHGGINRSSRRLAPRIERFENPRNAWNSAALLVDRSVIDQGDPTLMETKFINGYKDYGDLLKKETAWDPDRDKKKTMWRSMSGYELERVMQTGEIQSTNAMSFQHQAGMTFYSDSPSRGYAEDNFRPAVVAHIQEIHPDYPDPAFGQAAYIIEVQKPPTVGRNAQGEFYTMQPLPSDRIIRVVEVRPATQDTSDGSFGTFGYKDVTRDFIK